MRGRPSQIIASIAILSLPVTRFRALRSLASIAWRVGTVVGSGFSDMGNDFQVCAVRTLSEMRRGFSIEAES
jgi:hypothetical protein